MGKVKVVADKHGNIIGQSPNNPEYGYIRVVQKTIQINHEGWLKSVNRSALIKGKMEDLLAAEYKDGTELPGKIVVVESLIPFNPENPDKHLKVAGKAGVVCRLDDQPIYRESFYTSNMAAVDELIPHTNSDEIKDVMYAQKTIGSLSIDEADLEKEVNF
jgi:hypothetical protein